MSHVKDQITSTLKDEIGEYVDARCKEMDDRRRRELNVIVYNLPEAYNENNIRNKEEDETAIHKISTNLGIDNLGGVHMCAHTSSAHVIRTRHPLPSSARGVHMCTRPSSVKYVEYKISFVSVCGFVSLLLR